MLVISNTIKEQRETKNKIRGCFRWNQKHLNVKIKNNNKKRRHLSITIHSKIKKRRGFKCSL